jgi:hypothetical protein
LTVDKLQLPIAQERGDLQLLIANGQLSIALSQLPFVSRYLLSL